MNGPILVALDGSRFSERALPWALEMGRRSGTGVEIVTIAEPVPTLEYTDWNMQAEEWAAAYVEKVKSAQEPDAEVPITTHSSSGDPLEGILRRIEEIDASFAVAATHGRGPLSRAWIGSVADGLLRESPVPLLLVRPSEKEESDPTPAVSKVVLALDGSDFAASAEKHARRVARLFDAEIHLVQVVTYPTEVASPYLPQTVALNQSVLERAHEEAETHLERVAKVLRGEGFVVETHVDDDSQAATGIVRITNEIEGDMIVMATHGRGGVSRALLGSAADKVVRTAHTPVLVTPAAGIGER